ncbi:MAG: hypothetical protein AAFY72_17820, partial [Cyanobacteria bacterium J06649_4]
MTRLNVSRAVAFGITTALGWGAISSIGVPPSDTPPSPILSHADQATLLTASVGGQSILPRSPSVGSSEPSPAQPFQLLPSRAIAQTNQAAQLSGNRIRINGRTLSGFWQQKNGRIGIASTSMSNLIGVELLSTTVESQQPLRWFPTTQDAVMSLPAWWDATNRYIDITDLAVANGWASQSAGNLLQLALPEAQTTGIRQGKQTWGDRIVVDVTGPTTWQLEETDVFTVTVAGSISSEMVRAFRATAGNLITKLHVAPLNGQTVLKIKAKDGARPQIWTAGNPSRVVIDIRRDAMVERDVAWAPGLRWRQQYIN